MKTRGKKYENIVKKREKGRNAKKISEYNIRRRKGRKEKELRNKKKWA